MSGVIKTQIVEVKQYVVEYAFLGRGSPSIVLINGSGGHLDSWFRIFDKLSVATATLAYNRPGIGKSDPDSSGQTIRNCSLRLLDIIDQIGIEPPWILVGHSFGGLIANFLARHSPASVGGVVMLDATAPQDVEYSTQMQERTGLLSRLGRLFGPKVQHSEISHSQESVRELESASPFPPYRLRF